MEENNKDTQEVEKDVETTEQEQPTKTYTKEDLDNSFNAGVKKASTDWQKDEKYKEFLKWKKNNQSDVEKMTELTNQNNEQAKEITYLKAQLEVSNSNVKKEFAKFVTNEVLDLVNENTDFEKALKTFKKDNPQYFGDVVVKKVQSSPNLNGGTSQPQNTNDIMNSIIRGAKDEN